MGDEDFFWYPQHGGCPNEKGWANCNDPSSTEFRPDLDRRIIDIKIHCILMDMHEANLVYVSNGTMGDGIAALVADLCRKEDRYDQDFIVTECAKACMSDGRFWREQAKKWDPRAGELAEAIARRRKGET